VCPRQQRLQMSGVTADATAASGSAGKGRLERGGVARGRPRRPVLQDTIIGANQSASTLGRRILPEFLKDGACPGRAECVETDKSNLDARRWHGLSAVATWAAWNRKVRSPCLRLRAVYRRIHTAQLTGGLYTDEAMRRLATAMYNSVEGANLAHAYDILRNDKYVIGPCFSVTDAYEFLSTKTSLLADGMQVLFPVVVDDDVAAGKSAESCSDTAAADTAFKPVSLGLIAKRPSVAPPKPKWFRCAQMSP
jgi:hypothetical protein